MHDTTSASTTEALLHLADLQLGQPIIHRDWGVGRYQGLIQFEQQEWIKLQYADGQSLHLSPADAALLLPYRGDPDAAPLHALGSASWRKNKAQLKQEMDDVAAELLALYAAREAAEGLPLSCSEDDKKRFAAAFPYALTPDQAAAIAAVEQDLAAVKPMDRLLCGDVGFGKTEVALRAAWIAIRAGYQVAVIAPTTLLAEQHEQQWLKRFEGMATLCALHRFKSAKAQQSALIGLHNGEIDLVIGTHRLLQDDVSFKRLGLLIIDEEQRFGVKQKERLKSLRHNINLLSLSATPIPRTLNMALHGLRDLSLMQTPPAGRLPVRTTMSVWDDDLIRLACMREQQRGGQVYFLHNDVASMARIGDQLSALLPESRIALAHGQMKERELEAIMHAFQDKRFDVLLASTIIESGIDLPNANTIIINRADRLGLGQLHQLRGRVGRSDQQAYAYLLTPEESQMQGKTKERLQAFCRLDSTRASFMLASQDLEMRGAGTLLGAAQSGQVQQLGMAYYWDALQSALRRLRQPQSASELHFSSLHQPYFDADYMPLPHQRLDYYQQLSRLRDAEALRQLQGQIERRFGTLSAAGEALFAHHRLRIQAEALPLRSVKQETAHYLLQCSELNEAQQSALIQLLQQQPQRYRLLPPDTLRIEGNHQDLKRFLTEWQALFQD